MRSGLLNERLRVFSITNTTDSNGANVASFTAVGSYWCRVLHNYRDRSDNDVDRVVYNPAIRFELRSSVPISDDNLIRHDGILYVIDRIERNKNLDIQIISCSRYEQ